MKAERARIKDIYEAIREYGYEIILDERFLILKSFVQHRTSNTYDHCLNVTRIALSMAKEFRVKVDIASLVRGCLLHDYYGYAWRDTKPRWHGHRHPRLAAENAKRDFGINALEENMILGHMWPINFFVFSKSREAFILTLADKMATLEEVFAPRGEYEGYRLKLRRAEIL
ncbi:MAG: HD domain-containing protein [Bacilli bacterium]|nr:HD domain-containing protein [Bacilli bacterium]